MGFGAFAGALGTSALNTYSRLREIQQQQDAIDMKKQEADRQQTVFNQEQAYKADAANLAAPGTLQINDANTANFQGPMPDGSSLAADAATRATPQTDAGYARGLSAAMARAGKGTEALAAGERATQLQQDQNTRDVFNNAQRAVGEQARLNDLVTSGKMPFPDWVKQSQSSVYQYVPNGQSALYREDNGGQVGLKDDKTGQVQWYDANDPKIQQQAVAASIPHIQDAMKSRLAMQNPALMASISGINVNEARAAAETANAATNAKNAQTQAAHIDAQVAEINDKIKTGNYGMTEYHQGMLKRYQAALDKQDSLQADKQSAAAEMNSASDAYNDNPTPENLRKYNLTHNKMLALDGKGKDLLDPEATERAFIDKVTAEKMKNAMTPAENADAMKFRTDAYAALDTQRDNRQVTKTIASANPGVDPAIIAKARAADTTQWQTSADGKRYVMVGKVSVQIPDSVAQRVDAAASTAPQAKKGLVSVTTSPEYRALEQKRKDALRSGDAVGANKIIDQQNALSRAARSAPAVPPAPTPQSGTGLSPAAPGAGGLAPGQTIKVTHDGIPYVANLDGTPARATPEDLAAMR